MKKRVSWKVCTLTLLLVTAVVLAIGCGSQNVPSNEQTETDAHSGGEPSPDAPIPSVPEPIDEQTPAGTQEPDSLQKPIDPADMDKPVQHPAQRP